jgi:hypothetical protein
MVMGQFHFFDLKNACLRQTGIELIRYRGELILLQLCFHT